MIIAGPATPETDAQIRKQGVQAALDGKHRDACPYQDKTSLAAGLWYEGYDSVPKREDAR